MSDLKFPQINQIAVTGRLTQDPEFRLLEAGKAVVHFSVAANRLYRDDSDHWQDETSFIPVVVWDKLAEYVAERLQKGGAVIITGRLKSRTFEAENGNRNILEVVAKNIQLLDKEEAEVKEEKQG